VLTKKYAKKDKNRLSTSNGSTVANAIAYAILVETIRINIIIIFALTHSTNVSFALIDILALRNPAIENIKMKIKTLREKDINDINTIPIINISDTTPNTNNTLCNLFLLIIFILLISSTDKKRGNYVSFVYS